MRATLLGGVGSLAPKADGDALSRFLWSSIGDRGGAGPEDPVVESAWKIPSMLLSISEGSLTISL